MDYQKTWDACLIRCWRKDLAIRDAVAMYQSIVGQEPEGLLRMPAETMPRKIRVQVFMDSYLHKISERLWAQDASKDVALLNKLQTSKYDTSATQWRSSAGNGLQSAKKSIKTSKAKSEMDIWKYSRRNHATDWNTHQ